MASVAPEPALTWPVALIVVVAGLVAAALAGYIITPSTVPLAPPAPVPQARAPLPKPLAIPSTWQGKPISAWRRAYILKHHHQPPVAR